MNAAPILHRAAAALLLALAACAPQQPASALAEPDARLPEPRASTTRPAALTGLPLAVAEGATELFVIDADRARLSHPAGTVGDADADSAATLAAVRAILAELRIWAEDGGVIVAGGAPFAGRARSQTRGGVLRFSLTHHHAGGPPEGTLTVEVRGEEISGRLTRRSSPGDEQRWMHSAFFRAPLRRVPPDAWPLPAPQ